MMAIFYDPELRARARHEAAHIVVAAHEGVRVTEVALLDTGDGRAAHVNFDVPSDAGAHSAILAAGRAHVIESRLGVVDDRFRGDERKIEALRAGKNWHVDRLTFLLDATSRARQILRRYRTVDSLARALLERGADRRPLSELEVRELIATELGPFGVKLPPLRAAEPAPAPERNEPAIIRRRAAFVDHTVRLRASDPGLMLAISSEHPVLRGGPLDQFYEVLDHSPASVDLSRASDGLPLLLSHASHDASQQVGIVENVRVDPDRVLRGVARFSGAPGAQQIRQDMLDGIRKSISVGYQVDDSSVTVSKGKDGTPIERIMRWTPLEVSSVPIPADPTVGVGRKLAA